MTGPALAVLELASIARGMVIADAAVKRAAVELLRADAVTPGKFIVVLRGGEEEVQQAYLAGTELAEAALIDRMYLARADTSLLFGLDQRFYSGPVDSIGVVETFSVASTLLSADRALKTADVRLAQLRLARGLGGKGYFVLSGVLDQLEAAIEAASSIIHDGMLMSTEIIARPHPEFLAAL